MRLERFLFRQSLFYCCCCSHYFPFFTGECINQVRTIASLYANLHRLLRACPHVDLPIIAEGFSYHDFRWAVSTVMSRQNKIVLNHEAKVFSPALIPLWDFCNHCQGQVERHTDRQTHRQRDITFAFYTFTEVFFTLIHTEVYELLMPLHYLCADFNRL